MRFVLLPVFLLQSGCAGIGDVLDLAIVGQTVTDGELILPSGSPRLVRVTAKNTSGAEVLLNPFDVRWSSSDATLISLEQTGTDCRVTARENLLDAVLANDVQEPSAGLVVAYGENEEEIVARSVIDAGGDWSVALEPGTDFETRLDFTIEQSGREITATSLAMSGEGEVFGRNIVIVSGGNVLRGIFFRNDGRLRVQGAVVYDTGNNGQWSAIRKE